MFETARDRIFGLVVLRLSEKEMGEAYTESNCLSVVGVNWAPVEK